MVSKRVSEKSLAGQADEHQMDHRHVDHRLGRGGEVLVVLAQPAVVRQPGEGALHDPAPGQHLEALDVVVALDDLEQPAAVLPDPGHQLAPIAAVGPQQPQPGAASAASTSLAPARSCSAALWTTTASSSPSVSTARCRLRPLTFFPAS